MADKGTEESQIQLSWPLPPEHYKNAANLVPPPVPTNDNTFEYLAVFQTPIFETFKTQFSSLEEQVNLLYDKNTLKPAEELKKLNMSLLFNFLELIEKQKSPDLYEACINEKIEPILKNMHHLLNLYRPHQARQTLIAIMEQQIERRKAFLKSIVETMERSERILQRAKRNLSTTNTTTSNPLPPSFNSNPSSFITNSPPPLPTPSPLPSTTNNPSSQTTPNNQTPTSNFVSPNSKLDEMDIVD